MKNIKAVLKKKEDIRIRNGHLWVFSNEIFRVEEDAENGDIVDVYDSKNEFLGAGFYNKNSLIAIRLLSKAKIDDLKEVFREKLIAAKKLRDELYPGRESYRLVFSESDFLPGLIIDRYNNAYVMQVYSYGMEKNIGLITDILKEDFNAVNIFTKNEPYFRKLEGLPEEDKIYLGAMTDETITEGGVKYKIDFAGSHKTGFYFDQTDNRIFIERLCRGKNVIDAFCNSGGFGMHAALSGAGKVYFVDASASEIEKARYNFKLNSFECDSEFIVKDVFDFLESAAGEGKKFDVVMIDPPAFAKNKKSLPVARKGYERLNRLALDAVNSGGWLVTSSCSFHLAEGEFLQAVSKAALKAGRKIQLVHFNNASHDHPKLPQMAETSYLKFAAFKVE
jgi:23S rRNA (cytosine1962-C5)-methyltransferase